MSKNLWRKDYEAFYRNHREEGRAVYDIEWCARFIKNRLLLPEVTTCTLLDVGCGDGVWSLVLSDYFVVTGIDNSTEAEKNFQMLKGKYPTSSAVEFMRGDVLQLSESARYDYLFCRGPEFFGGYHPESEVFRQFETALMKMFRMGLYFIVYSKPPFSRYANDEKTSYFHDPSILAQRFQRYGRVYVSYTDNYIVLTVLKDCKDSLGLQTKDRS